MTAQELADHLTKDVMCNRGHMEAAAMLRTQAAEIESLKKMLVISDDTHQMWMKQNSPGGWIDDLRKERDGLLQAISDRDSILRQYSAEHAAKVAMKDKS